jgi:hypothetical protein
MPTRFNLSALSSYRSAKFALALLTIAVCMTLWKEERYVSAQVCCSRTGQSPNCYHSVLGAGVISCYGTIYCDGLACSFEALTNGIIADTNCSSGYAWVGTYPNDTEIHAEGEIYNNCGLLKCSSDTWRDCYTGEDSGNGDCSGSCDCDW